MARATSSSDMPESFNMAITSRWLSGSEASRASRSGVAAGRSGGVPGDIVAFLQALFAGLGAMGLAVMIDANVAGDGIEPGEDRLPGAIGVAHFVYAQPGFLKQIVGVGAADEFRQKEAVHLGAEAE